MSLPEWSEIEEKFWGMQDMNIRLLSENIDFDSRLQHVSCCVLDECPDSGEFRVHPVFLWFLVGTSFSRLVWAWHGTCSPGSCGNSRVLGYLRCLDQ